MHYLIGASRHNVFLDQHLDAVRDGLEKSERPDAIWPVTILHPPENFSFQHRDEREEREKYAEQSKNVDEGRCYLRYPIRSAGQWYEQQLLYANENLVMEKSDARLFKQDRSFGHG